MFTSNPKIFDSISEFIEQHHETVKTIRPISFAISFALLQLVILSELTELHLQPNVMKLCYILGIIGIFIYLVLLIFDTT